MKPGASARPGNRGAAAILGLVVVTVVWAAARAGPSNSSADVGPYNVTFLAGGVGLSQPLPADASVLRAGAAWSMGGWVRVDRWPSGPAVIAALGDGSAAACRCLFLDQGHIALRLTPQVALHSATNLELDVWHGVAGSYDGHTARLYVDGVEVASSPVATANVAAVLRLAPENAEDSTGAGHFGGSLAYFSLTATPPSAAAVADLYARRPDFSLIYFHQVGSGWPWQEHAWRGLLEPQPAWTLPHSNAPFSASVARPAAPTPALQEIGPDRWWIGDWRLAAAPGVDASAQAVSTVGYGVDHWYPAVVPGTVLTTLIAAGVYPDPDYGLNNMAIPESLNRQDYWYRSQFDLPADLKNRELTLTFKGVNYAAEVWVNGTRLGDIHGAFVRGIFNVTSLMRVGSSNVLAVRVSPPPHPGIPHEQSIAAGPGENGGNLAIDGPTFVASEGWDWIPAIRDRNTGLWQGVELAASGMVRILDPQVVTKLPLPRLDSAEVSIQVPLENRSATPLRATIKAQFDAVQVSKTVVVNPGLSMVPLDPAEFPQLRLSHPRLWWPNGYGAAELYSLALSVTLDEVTSDTKTVRFGIREISYELSLFDHHGALRRVEVDPTADRAHHAQLIDVSHAGIKRVANGWAESLTAAGENSPAVHDIDSTALTPYLAIRVNGVRIAARGGSWGTDDSRKRVSREHLEPFFKLHRAAHLNIIRNWLGQNTEDVFYDLADEYGLLILNDFWASTQDFQVEPQDPQLFLNNAADVIRRYRNHPSIAVWFGRNEGVPQPIINEGLAALVAELDGTRYYTGSSNSVNLQGSGPYNYRPPLGYFTDLAVGFSVEVGTPSLASLESLRAMMPKADLWPLSDSYAYHDWHFGGNGDTKSFMQALSTNFGAARDLEDFERKAQLMNYESYRAIFEGFAAHLWTRNSGRLLWMTHPAWPSNSWQIYTADYDTPAAYYAVAKACEPLHAQLNLPEYSIAVVNTTRETQTALRLHSRVWSLDDRLLLERAERVDAAADATTTLAALDLRRPLEQQGVVLVELQLKDAKGNVLSTNTYWLARDNSDLRQLTVLPQQTLVVSAASHPGSEDNVVEIALANHGRVPALLAKVTLLDGAGERVLPVYYSDNYVSLMPGESTAITARCPLKGHACQSVSLGGWNVVPMSARLKP
jgi:beta-galactosidase/beta-glucuronidase